MISVNSPSPPPPGVGELLRAFLRPRRPPFPPETHGVCARRLRVHGGGQQTGPPQGRHGSHPQGLQQRRLLSSGLVSLPSDSEFSFLSNIKIMEERLNSYTL